MRKIRYYKLRALLKERGMTLEGLRERLGLLPSDMIKIETERPLAPFPLFLICEYLEKEAEELFDILPEEECDVYYSKRVLESHSYIPKRYIKKEF